MTSLFFVEPTTVQPAGAAGTKATIAGADRKIGAQVCGQVEIQVANGDGERIDVASNRKVQTIDASKRGRAVALIGNAVTSLVYGGTKNDTIDTSKLTIADNARGATINSGAGNDSVIGSMGADEVTLGAGADTFYTHGGDDTVETGAGKDVVVYEGGQVVITDYAAGSDIVELANGYSLYTEEANMTHSVDTDGTTVILNIAEHSVISGRDTVIISNTNSIRLLNALNKKLSIIDSEGKSSTLTLSDPTIEKVTNNSGSTITVGSRIRTIDSSSRTAAVAITGGANTTSIKGGKAGDTITLTATGGGTIEGAKGDDNLTGVAGKTFYAYTDGDGKDIITNYAEGDMIVLKTAKTKVNEAKSSVSGGDYVLTIGSGSITIRNGATKEIKVKYVGSDDVSVYNTQETSPEEKAYEELFDNFVDSDQLTAITKIYSDVDVDVDDLLIGADFDTPLKSRSELSITTSNLKRQ